MTARDLILPSFFADSISLGPHWIYDSEELSTLYPNGIKNYDSPRSPYHAPSGKTAGDFTHFGEQSLALLRSVSKHGWSISSWKKDWIDWANNTRAYMDGASKRTLENLTAGIDHPSSSSDLAGAARIAPLFAVLDDAQLILAVRAQTALTHGDPQVIDAAEFFTRAALAICNGSDFDEAFDAAASHPYDGLSVIDYLAEARQAADGDLTRAAGRIGLACNVTQAFPVSLAIALKHGTDPVTALTTNALLGGDSAARGMPLGLLLGAKHGVSAFPDHWRTDLRAGDEIDALLASINS